MAAFSLTLEARFAIATASLQEENRRIGLSHQRTSVELMMGAMARQGTGATLGSGAATPGGGLMSMLTPMLDANRDGSIVDDVMGMLGKFGR